MRKENREYVEDGVKDLFVPYKLSWDLQHEKDVIPFDENCVAFWNHYQELHMNHTYDDYGRHLKAPMYQQVISWLKDKYKIKVVENPQFGWNVYIASGNKFVDVVFCSTIDESIEEAIKTIKLISKNN